MKFLRFLRLYLATFSGVALLILIVVRLVVADVDTLYDMMREDPWQFTDAVVTWLKVSAIVALPLTPLVLRELNARRRR